MIHHKWNDQAWKRHNELCDESLNYGSEGDCPWHFHELKNGKYIFLNRETNEEIDGTDVLTKSEVKKMVIGTTSIANTLLLVIERNQ